jgi:hypothetical protein
MMSLPSVVTNVREQLEGGSKNVQRIRKNKQRKATADPPRAHISLPPVGVPSDIFIKKYRWCNYIFPDGEACRDRGSAKHWMADHAMMELRKIESGELSESQATILTTQARRRVAQWYRVYCPYRVNCDLLPEAWLVLPSDVMTHVFWCAKRHDISMSWEDAKMWGKNNMVLSDSAFSVPRCKDDWESAIWRIYHAR